MGTPIVDVFNFSKSYFFLGTRSHKQVTCDALWERIQGTKLTFLARGHLAPKFSKVVAKAKKLGAIKKKDS